MAYATQSDWEASIGSPTLVAISDFDGDGTADAAPIARALDEASSKIDSYISAFLPMAIVPESIRNACIAIAGFIIRGWRDMNTEDSRLAYKEAIDWLKLVAAGKASLGTADGVEVDEESGVGDPEAWSEDERGW